MIHDSLLIDVIFFSARQGASIWRHEETAEQDNLHIWKEKRQNQIPR